MVLRPMMGLLVALAAPTLAAAQVNEAMLSQPAGAEWLQYGRDFAETHYSPLDQITSANVSRLASVWSWEPPDVSSSLVFASTCQRMLRPCLSFWSR
jgi:glucose dehydrogenase